MQAIFESLAHQPMVALFLVIGAGMFIGHLKLKGVGLDAAAVLFLAIALTAAAKAYGAEIKIPTEVGHMGLALFTFAIGVNAGASFFHNLKTAVGPIITMVAIYGVTAFVGIGVGRGIFDMPYSLIAGTFSGALTNTPALAAAGAASGDPNTATIGYSIAYLFGVIGMLVAAIAALAYGKNDSDTTTSLSNRTIRVEREDSPVLRDIYDALPQKVTFSRLRRGEDGPISRPSLSDTLNAGDLISVVGPDEAVARVATELGHFASTADLVADRTYLDFRRMTVSNAQIAGRTIADLKLSERFGATVSRVRRGDTDMFADPRLLLQMGDRVRVVAPAGRMGEVTKFFGDSARGLTDLNPVALGLGMALGLFIGHIPIPMGGGATFHIGAAAGTLIVGLLFGRVGRVGNFVTTLPFTTGQVIAHMGLLLFLAQAGANAGGQIAGAFSSGTWVSILILGMAMTTTAAVLMYSAMRWFFRMGGTQLSGVLAGMQTQPAILAFANARTLSDPRVALGYALVYPVAMIGKIFVAHVLASLGG